MSQSERNRLPGGPSNVLIRRVRARLAWYGIRPTYSNGQLWRATWDWAHAISESYLFPHLLKRNLRWPPANEIASQYVFLLLNAMREGRDLRLPYRAAGNVPPSVRALLPAGQIGPPALGLADESAAQLRLPLATV